MEFLQRALDDPEPGPCGKCSVCTGVAPGPGPKADSSWLRLARDFSRGVDVIVEPRKKWPSGLYSGAIHGLREGRALAYANDPAWSDGINAMVESDYLTIPDELLAGLIEALTRWSREWTERPTWIMPAPAAGQHREANRLVAAHVADKTGLPLHEPFEWVGEPLPHNSASGKVVEHLASAVHFRPDVSLPTGPVLLCSATTRTRWTAAWVARLLSERKAGAVLPLALHQLP